MKRLVAFILIVAVMLNLLIIAGDKVVYAIEPDIIWLDKSYIEVGSFSDGMARVATGDFYPDYKYGYIDTDGNEIISLIYETADDFSEGLASISRSGQYGYIDKTGKEVISLKYDYAGAFHEGLARVVRNDKCGYIDKTGKEIIPLKYDWAGDFSEGVARIVLNDKYGFINKLGKEIVSLKYDEAGDFREGLAPVRVNYNSGYGYIDKTGKEIIPSKYSYAWEFSEGLARVGLDKGFGYIDKTGKEIIKLPLEPSIYNEGYSLWPNEEVIFEYYEDIEGERKHGEARFNEGAVLVGFSWEGKGVFIDKEGKEFLPTNYNYYSSLNEGLIKAGLNDKIGYIDKTGKEVIPIEFEDATSFNEGLAIVTYEGKKAIVKNPLEFKSGGQIIEKEIEKIKYKGIKKVYYEYLNEFALKGYYYMGAESAGKNAILLDLNGDKVPELITIDYTYSDWGSLNYKINVLRAENGKLKSLFNEQFYSDNSWSSQIEFAEDNNTKEQFMLYHGSFHKQGLGEYISTYKLIEDKMVREEKFGWDASDKWVEGRLEYIEEFTVDEKSVDEGYYKNRLEKFKNSIKTVWLEPVDLTSEKIRNIIDSYMDRPMDISYDSGNIFAIIGSKTFLNLSLSEKDAALIYEIDNPDIIQITPNGEIIGLKEGTGNIKITARKAGFENAEVKIPVIVKPELYIDFTKVASTTNTKSRMEYLKEIFRTSDTEYFSDSETLTQITKLIDFIIKNESRGTVKSSKNIIVVNKKTIKKSTEDAKKIKAEIENLLKEQQINLQREIATTVRLDGTGINTNKAIGIKLEPSLVQVSRDLDFININVGEVELTLNVNYLDKEFKTKNMIQMQIKQIEKEGEKSYEVLFMDEKGNIIERLENNISFQLPIDNESPEYSSVFFNNGKSIEQLGGQYDPITNTIEFSAKLTGEYYVVENRKQYDDISHLSKEVQDAITFMASKGFINVRDGHNFDPDAEITRAEFTAFLVKTFYVLDRTLSTSFADVEKGDWYYDYVASSEKEEIIKGYPNQTFQGNNIINREQIVAICARALHEKKKYLYPENKEEFLPFIDSEEISDWAKKEVALAFREALIDIPEGRVFDSQKPMTRADATVIVYRLFRLLYETNPSELGVIETSDNNTLVFPIFGGGGLIIFLGVFGIKRRIKARE